MIASYSWRAGSEHMLCLGNERPIQIILIQPLFDEANRMRKTLVDVMRALYGRGFGVSLPDLPAMGESQLSLSDTTFEQWREAVSAVVMERQRQGQAVIIASFRGGTLIDDAAPCNGVWRCTQETGARLLRDISRMMRARSTTFRTDNVYDLAGYDLPLRLSSALEKAIPQPVSRLRTVRLLQDTHEADAHIAGASLWRRSEPQADSALTTAIVNDLADWATSCAKF